MKSIQSRQNEKFKTWLSLLEGRGIKKQRQAIISGSRLVSEFLKLHSSLARELLVPSKNASHIDAPKVEVFDLATELFRELDIFGTKSPLLVVETPSLEPWIEHPPKGLELIVALSDPGNLGAVLRSALAFNANRVVLCQECSSPFLPKAIRASSGACFALPLIAGPSIHEIKPQSAHCLDLEGEALTQFQWPQDLSLVLGEEGQGIPQSLHAKALTIPIHNKSESLNAMAAASIALFSYRSAWP